MNAPTTKSLQELLALQQRLAADVRRANLVDPGGLTRHDPLVKNLARVNEEIRRTKQEQSNG